MPVFLKMVRLAVCAICEGSWLLQADELPERCIHCGSGNWELGPSSKDSQYIRQRISHVKKVLNPGAASKKRQDQGRKQWRQFKPKPEEQKE